VPGKYPLSRNPRTSLRGIKLGQLFVKPNPMITAPQAAQIPGKKNLGPILRQRTIIKGWQSTYVMKKQRLTRL
jgi:hypothetical protein